MPPGASSCICSRRCRARSWPACGAQWSGLVARRAFEPGWRLRALCILGALAAPLCGIGVSLGRFYTSPMVFAFDPFFGYFAGPLYDTVIDAFWTLATYRAGSLLSLLGVGCSAAHFDDRPAIFGGFQRPWLAGVGAAALLGSALFICNGTTLGHFSTRASIEAALGQQVYGARCDVKYSCGILRRDALLFARDCDAELRADEAYFEIAGPARVTAFLFASEAEKGRLMGASSTYIAKPWRREIYVQYAAYPHPVVGHELAHVLAGSFGQGPFRVSGPLGGWIPDPGRIEGVAVAASPNDNDDFTLDEWAKTLLDLSLLPPLESVFRLGFLGQNSSTAYTVAGAFVHWFHDHYGASRAASLVRRRADRERGRQELRRARERVARRSEPSAGSSGVAQRSARALRPSSLVRPPLPAHRRPTQWRRQPEARQR